MNDITKGMSQEELVKQCLYVVTFPDKNINVHELLQMEMKIKYPRNKYGVVDLESDLYKKMEIAREKIRQLLFYYN